MQVAQAGTGVTGGVTRPVPACALKFQCLASVASVAHVFSIKMFEKRENKKCIKAFLFSISLFSNIFIKYLCNRCHECQSLKFQWV